MTTASLTGTLTPPRQRLRSTGAVFAGVLAVFVLSTGVDQILHSLQVFPPWGTKMGAGLFLLALAYRTVFNVSGGYITARLAPANPLRHAFILGLVGVVLSVAGLIASLVADLGPVWYPLALVLEAVPCAWLGGKLYVGQQAGA
jgi:hypothetical protein